MTEKRRPGEPPAAIARDGWQYHVAFAVDDLDEALKGKAILIAPTAPSPGVRVAFILDDGAPVELLQFDKAAGA